MDDMSGYESPITMEVKKCCDKIIEERENAIMMRLEEEIGFHIDRNELIKALKYDREQYAKGYREGYEHGKEEILRVKGSWNYIQSSMPICPFCGASAHKHFRNFCPHCGADLREVITNETDN